MFRFAENDRLEGQEARSVSPGAGRKSRLLAQVVQHLIPSPSLFRGDLGEKHGGFSPLLEEDAIPADDNVVRAGDRFHRRQHGNLNFQIGQIRGRHGAEARILEGGLEGHRTDELGEGPVRDHPADAAAQVSPLLEGDEDPARFAQDGAGKPGQGDHFYRKISGDRLPREAKQVFPVGGSNRPFHRRCRSRSHGGGILFRIGGQDDRPIADDPLPLADGKVSGVGVAYDPAPGRPHRLGGRHRGHDGGLAAGAGGEVRYPPGHLRPDGRMERRRIEGGDGRKRLHVRGLGVFRRRVVGEVGARDDHGAASLQDRGQCVSEAGAEDGVRLADDRSDDLRLGKEDLGEGNLDLERVFPDVRLPVEGAVGRCGKQRRREIPVHYCGSERRPEAAARVEGDLPEAGGRVVRAQDDNDVIGPAAELVPAVGADLPGVDVPRVGDDNGDRFFHLRRQRVLDEFLDSKFQDGRRFGVELSGHGGGTHLAPPVLPGHAGRCHPQAEGDDGDAELQNGHDLSPFQSTPDAGDPPAAEAAAAVFNMHFHGEEAGAPDDRLPAGRAVGMVSGMVRDVSHIGVMQPPPHRRLPGPLQRRHRRGRQVAELVVRMEAVEVDGDVGSNLSPNPVDQAAQHLLGVVQRRDDEVDDLQMGAALCDLLDAPQDGPQLGAADVAVERLVVPFQVDLDCVQHLAELGERRLVHDPATDQDGAEPLPFRLPGDVDQVLRKDRRLVVGEGDHRRPPLPGGADDPVGGERRTFVILRRGLGDLPVLAELAPQRAAGGGERVGRGAGEEVVEGLLLDRVDVNRDRMAIDEALQFAADVHPGAAAAALAGPQHTTLGAQKALDHPGLMADGFPFQDFQRGVACAAVGASLGDGGPEARPRGETDQIGLRIEGEEQPGIAARQQALPEGRGETEPRPAEDWGDPGQGL